MSAVGLLFSFILEDQYESSCSFLPEQQGAPVLELYDMMSLSGGIPSGNSTNDVSPILYSEIVHSFPFLSEIFQRPIKYQKPDTFFTSYQFFEARDKQVLHYITGEACRGEADLDIGMMFSTWKGNVVDVDKDNLKLLEDFGKRISVVVSPETGIISVSAEMPDPLASAGVAQLVVETLSNEIIKLKLAKIRDNLSFVEERLLEAKKDYEGKQTQMAQFADQHKNLASAFVETEYQRMQNDLNVSFEVYSNLARELEQLKIALKNETPVFTVLKPVQIPVKKSSPKRFLILMTCFFVGIFFTSCYAIYSTVVGASHFES